jgi:hypothetical protein
MNKGTSECNIPLTESREEKGSVRNLGSPVLSPQPCITPAICSFKDRTIVTQLQSVRSSRRYAHTYVTLSLTSEG